MQDFGTKADNSPPPGGQLSAAEFNNLANEAENAVLRAGLTLSGASATQLAESMFLHGVKAEAFQDSGAANAYVATPVSGTSGVLLPATYANMGGAIILFKASAANTGASTLNIGQTTGTLLGAKQIRTQNDTPILSGSISAGQYVQLIYNSAFNGGAGAWEILPWAANQQLPQVIGARALLLTPGASVTITADTVIFATAPGGRTWQVNNFSATINLATTGAGGMDTGTATANGHVGVYAIYNPTTQVSALLATMETAAVLPRTYGGGNMPSGFTASVLISVIPIHTVAGQFVAFFQSGNSVDWTGVGVLVASATIVTGQARGSTGFPFSAKFVSGFNQVSNSAAAAVSQVLSSSATSTIGGQFNTCNLTAGSSQAIPFRVQISVPQNIYQTTTSSGGTPGFTISVKNFEF